MRPGYLHGINNFWFSGHEEEGFYDILTGRPRYPAALHNIVRSDRLMKRKDRLAQKLASQPGGVKTYFPKPAGLSYNVPNLKRILEEPKRQPQYSRYYWPAIL